MPGNGRRGQTCLPAHCSSVPPQCSVPMHSAPVSPQGSYSKEGRTPDRGYNASPAFLTMTFAFPLAYSCSWTCVSLNICFLLRPINFIRLSSITHEPVNGERDGGDSSSVILLPLRLIRLTLSDCWKECLNWLFTRLHHRHLGEECEGLEKGFEDWNQLCKAQRWKLKDGSSCVSGFTDDLFWGLIGIICRLVWQLLYHRNIHGWCQLRHIAISNIVTEMETSVFLTTCLFVLSPLESSLTWAKLAQKMKSRNSWPCFPLFVLCPSMSWAFSQGDWILNTDGVQLTFYFVNW